MMEQNKKKVFVAMSPQKSLQDSTGQAGGVDGKKVFVAMSGGVDSSVAAALLQERGFDVTGVHIKMWSDPDIPCNFKEDRLDAMRVAAHLGIPFETWDLTEEYKQAVVEYMIREYAARRTPNPDVMCNREIKFGVFLRRALERDAEYIATGHYARTVPFAPLLCRHASFAPAAKLAQIGQSDSATSGNQAHSALNGLHKNGARPCAKGPIDRATKLLKGRDDNKDQSYFLWTLTQDQLKHCLFPIGEYAKPKVREMAREFGLPTAEKKDSQGICFIGEIDIRKFLKKHIPAERGAVLTTSGRRVGEHEGVEFYTIGQRRGIGAVGGGIPYYVAEKNFTTNTLTVAEGPYDERLFGRELIATDVNWIAGTAPKLPLRCEARIRYRQPLQRCRVLKFISSEVDKSETYQLTNLPTYKLKVVLDEPQRAITPGQSVVFYRGEEMLGGGCIGG